MHNWLRAIPFLIMLALCMAMAASLLAKKTGTPLASSDYAIADFTVPMLDEKNGQFSPAIWNNKTVVLNVFASWCEPCAIEHTALMNLAKTGKVTLLGLAWKDSPENIRAWLKKRGNPYHMVGFDTQGKSTIALGLTGVPETMVLSNNRVVFNVKSVINDAIIQNDIIPLVERLSNE